MHEEPRIQGEAEMAVETALKTIGAPLFVEVLETSSN
jgi:hypothetical protein